MRLIEIICGESWSWWSCWNHQAIQDNDVVLPNKFPCTQRREACDGRKRVRRWEFLHDHRSQVRIQWKWNHCHLTVHQDLEEKNYKIKLILILKLVFVPSPNSLLNNFRDWKLLKVRFAREDAFRLEIMSGAYPDVSPPSYEDVMKEKYGSVHQGEAQSCNRESYARVPLFSRQITDPRQLEQRASLPVQQFILSRSTSNSAQPPCSSTNETQDEEGPRHGENLMIDWYQLGQGLAKLAGRWQVPRRSAFQPGAPRQGFFRPARPSRLTPRLTFFTLPPWPGPVIALPPPYNQCQIWIKLNNIWHTN